MVYCTIANKIKCAKFTAANPDYMKNIMRTFNRNKYQNNPEFRKSCCAKSKETRRINKEKKMQATRDVAIK